MEDGRKQASLGDLPDVGAPVRVKKHEVEDRFEYDVAFKFGFIGVGQAGGRIANTFYNLGYGRIGVVNTALEDLEEIDPAIQKLDLGTGGAGKDPERGAMAVEGQEERVWDLMTRAIGADVDYLLICAGLGGGTGSGATPKILEIARKYMEENGGDPSRVGAVVALPSKTEGATPCKNAVKAFKTIYSQQPSPMIIIDNQRIEQIYEPGITQLFNVCNTRVSQMFHLFNNLAAQRAGLISFDRADYANILDAGITIFGASAVGSYNSPADISEAIRAQLSATTLAEVDLSKGTRAGCIFVGSNEILGQVPLKFFDGGFTMLNRLLADDSAVHRGVYEGHANDLRCYTIISGLTPPAARLRELSRVGGIKPDSKLAEFFDI